MHVATEQWSSDEVRHAQLFHLKRIEGEKVSEKNLEGTVRYRGVFVTTCMWTDFMHNALLTERGNNGSRYAHANM